MYWSFASLLLAATLASAKTIRVDAGPELTFQPDDVQAMPGDVLEFHFMPINHSVAMGEFSNACQPATTGGFFSGYLPVQTGEASETFRVTVNDTQPMYFYCTQNFHSHCKGGMVGAVNAPMNASLAMYKTKSMAFGGMAGEPIKVFGGTLERNTASGSSMGGGSNSTNGAGSPSSPKSPEKGGASGLRMAASAGASIVASMFASLMW